MAAAVEDWLVSGAEFPPPGRVRVSFDEARAMLVDHPVFEGSVSRPAIWDGLERYLANFFRVEEELAEILGGADLLHYLWLGGSFVSSKLDPKNLDLSVVIDGAARELAKGQPGSGWLSAAFVRTKVLPEYLLSPLEVLYRPVPSPFDSRNAPAEHQTYLRERGAWDDWWQRTRDPVTGGAPTIHTCRSVRGYLEVTL